MELARVVACFRAAFHYPERDGYIVAESGDAAPGNYVRFDFSCADICIIPPLVRSATVVQDSYAVDSQPNRGAIHAQGRPADCG